MNLLDNFRLQVSEEPSSRELRWSSSRGCTKGHRITERCELEGTSQGGVVHPLCSKHGDGVRLFPTVLSALTRGNGHRRNC